MAVKIFNIPVLIELFKRMNDQSKKKKKLRNKNF